MRAMTRTMMSLVSFSARAPPIFSRFLIYLCVSPDAAGLFSIEMRRAEMLGCRFTLTMLMPTLFDARYGGAGLRRHFRHADDTDNINTRIATASRP